MQSRLNAAPFWGPPVLRRGQAILAEKAVSVTFAPDRANECATKTKNYTPPRHVKGPEHPCDLN